MAFVTAMMAESGLPLFTRASKGLESLSYSAIGSLFGITTYVRPPPSSATLFLL